MRGWLSGCIIAMVALAFSVSAEGKGKKGKGRVGAKPAKIEKKVGKKAGKHDLGAVLDAHKGKGKGKGKTIDKGTPDDAKDAKAVEPGAPDEAAIDKGKKGKGHAWGKDKKFHELRKHFKRMAKIRRLEDLAKEGKNDKLLTKIQLLRDKEQKRHERVVARVETKEAIEDVTDAPAKAE